MQKVSRRTFLGFTALILTGTASAQRRRDRDNDGQREYQAVIRNRGRRTHDVRFRDRDDHKEQRFRLSPGQDLAPSRTWEGDTTVYVDGRRLGKLRDVARIERGTNGSVWVVEVHGR